MFGTQRVLRASGTRLAPTEPEARPQVQILSHRFLGRGAGNIGLTVFPVLFLSSYSSSAGASASFVTIPSTTTCCFTSSTWI